MSEPLPKHEFRIEGIVDNQATFVFWGGAVSLPLAIAQALIAGEPPGKLYRLHDRNVEGQRALMWMGGQVLLPLHVINVIEGLEGSEARNQRHLQQAREVAVAPLATLPNDVQFAELPPWKICSSCKLQVPPSDSPVWPGYHAADCSWAPTVRQLWAARAWPLNTTAPATSVQPVP